jgi:hypothetical protein
VNETSPAELAERLKERIYVSFTALAVVIAIDSHGESTAREALVTLLITVAGTLLAVFIADVVARMTTNERVLTGSEMRHVAGVSLGAIGVVALPIIFLLLGLAGLWSDAGSIRAAIYALVAGLVVSGLLAVRRARLKWWQRLVALAALGLVGLAF